MGGSVAVFIGKLYCTCNAIYPFQVFCQCQHTGGLRVVAQPVARGTREAQAAPCRAKIVPGLRNLYGAKGRHKLQVPWRVRRACAKARFIKVNTHES